MTAPPDTPISVALLPPSPRAQSPAKRLKSEEPPPVDDTSADAMDTDGPVESTSDCVDDANTSAAVDDSQPPSTVASSSAQPVSTPATSTTTSAPPSIEEQLSRYAATRNVTPKLGETWYVLSCRWIGRFMAESPVYRPEAEKSMSKEELAAELGPIDNRHLVDTDQLGLLRKRRAEEKEQGASEDELVEYDFIPLLPGQLGMQFEVVPEEFWNDLVAWHGVAKDSSAIKRKVVDTAEPGNPPNESIELYPPMFTIYRIRDPKALITPQTLDSDKKEEPRQVVAGKTSSFVKFLKKVKNVTGVENGKKVRIWRVRRAPQEPADAAPKKKTGTFMQMVVDLAEFLKLSEGSEREFIDVKDQSDDAKYNGKLRVDMAGLGDGGSIILEEQTSNGEWASEVQTKQAKKFGQDVTVAKQGFGSAQTAKKKLPHSGRASPSKGLVKTAQQYFTRSRRNGRTMGTTGLSNLGNTCYMNSALQCLRSVEELSRYFLSDHYEKELNPDNPLAFYGKVAKAYAGLLEAMFPKSGSPSSSFAPREFKSTIGKFGPNFSGYQQQDSQEFLAFLLDGLHEDLNRIKKKPYNEKPDSKDELVHDAEYIKSLALEHWEIYKARNDSAVADLFAGLYKSTLQCPECEKVSITFDPFMDLTLPLPIENVWSHDVYVLPSNISKGHLKKLPVEISKNSCIADLKAYIGKKLNMDPKKLVGSEVYKERYYRHYDDSEIAADVIQSNDDAFFYELDDIPTNWPPPKGKKTSMLYPSTLDDDEDADPNKTGSDCLLVAVFNAKSTGRTLRSGSESYFGVPFFITVRREEAHDADAIIGKIIEKVEMLTSASFFEETEDDRQFEEVTDTEPNSDVEVKKGDEEKDGYVDVQMKDVQSEQTPSQGSQKKLKEGLDGIFKVKHSNRKSGDRLPTAWNGLDVGGYLSERMPEPDFNSQRSRSSSPKKSTVFAPLRDHNNGRLTPNDNDTASEEDNSVYQDAQDEPTRGPSPLMGDASDSDNDRPYHSERMSSFNTVEANDFYGSTSGSSPMKPTSRDPSPERTTSTSFDESPSALSSTPLIRWGEALIIEWSEQGHADIFGGDSTDTLRGHDLWTNPERIEDPELALKKKRRNERKQKGIHLEDCLDEFAKKEILSNDDLWYCPRCKDFRRASKQFGLFRCPDILVIHLKRFSSNRSFRDKIDVLVDAPLEGLDLSSRVGLQEDGRSMLYDLFAVDNHYGGLGGGHYTAYSKNWVDNQWYYCDDSSVTISHAPPVTPAAYLLFYRRRDSKPLGGPLFSEISTKDVHGLSLSETEGSSSESREASPDPPKQKVSVFESTGNSMLWGSHNASTSTSELPTYSESQSESASTNNQGLGWGFGGSSSNGLGSCNDFDDNADEGVELGDFADAEDDTAVVEQVENSAMEVVDSQPIEDVVAEVRLTPTPTAVVGPGSAALEEDPDV